MTGTVDTKLPESLWDSFTKYHRRCAVKNLAVAALYFDMLSQRMRISI